MDFIGRGIHIDFFEHVFPRLVVQIFKVQSHRILPSGTKYVLREHN